MLPFKEKDCASDDTDEISDLKKMAEVESNVETDQHVIDDDGFLVPIAIEKKKKKKKKTSFDLDAALGIVDDLTKKEECIKECATDSLYKEEEDFDFTSFGLKKKKKKKKPMDLNELVDALPSTSQAAAAAAAASSKQAADDRITDVDALDDLDFDFSQMKKKKKSKKKDLDELVKFEEPQDENQHDILTADDDGNWIDNGQDYTYDDLLQRAYNIIFEKNPNIAEGRRVKFTMRPPQVIRIGSRKTSFANFMDFAKAFHRVPKHLQDFVLSELGTNGSLDGNQQLIIKGRFQPKQLENVLRRYVKEYVTCKTCHSFNTILKKETRLFFLQCETCGSRCTVATIKSGFQAVTVKRAAMRARGKD